MGAMTDAPALAPSLRQAVVLNQLGSAVLSASTGVQVLDAGQDLAWERCHEADVLLTAPRNGWCDAPKEKPAGWPGRLRWVHLASVGIDYFPAWLFEGVQVSCARGVAAEPIADYVFSVLLEQSLALNARRAKNAADWERQSTLVISQPMRLLAEQTLGIVGYGAIGKAVAQRAKAFGMTVQALRNGKGSAQLTEDGTSYAKDLSQLLASSDHVVLALPLTAQSRGLINADALAYCKPGLHLINVARGGLVDQDALKVALDSGLLGAASLDVTEPEPLPEDHWLYGHEKVRLTPHISWAAGDVQAATRDKFAENLQRYRSSQALFDVVDLSKGY